MCVCVSFLGGVFVHVSTYAHRGQSRVSSLGIGVVLSLSIMCLLLVERCVSTGHPHACVQGREQFSGADPVPRLELGSSGLPAAPVPNELS